MTTDPDALTAELLSLADRAGSRRPVTDTDPAFDIAAAYAVAARIVAARRRRGETPIGWKIGFTNRTIWDEYNVRAPIWAPVYDSTAAAITGAGTTLSLGSLMEPRIEPELVFRLAGSPEPGMDEDALLRLIDGVALGFELVQSPYPDWVFLAPDCIAAFALHGRLRHQPFTDPAGIGLTRAALERFTVRLDCDGAERDTGAAANVLDGPLSALKALVDGLPDTPLGPRIAAGSIVTTGTLTRALPVRPGESWTMTVDGLPLPALTLDLAP
jgi:2-oxo-3-hexenedioate decarboxylase